MTPEQIRELEALVQKARDTRAKANALEADQLAADNARMELMLMSRQARREADKAMDAVNLFIHPDLADGPTQ